MDMKKFMDTLEKNSSAKALFEQMDAMEAIKGSGWYYVPKKSFLDGLLKVAVHEVGPDKWEILYCSPASKAGAAAKAGAKKLMAGKEIERLQDLVVMNEEVEGDKAGLKGWMVKRKWSGKFEDALKKCINLVQKKSDADTSAFQKA